jgi:hypothetical protein
MDEATNQLRPKYNLDSRFLQRGYIASEIPDAVSFALIILNCHSGGWGSIHSSCDEGSIHELLFASSIF